MNNYQERSSDNEMETPRMEGKIMAEKYDRRGTSADFSDRERGRMPGKYRECINFSQKRRNKGHCQVCELLLISNDPNGK